LCDGSPEIPNSKSQISNKSQGPKFEIPKESANHGMRLDLPEGFGHWIFGICYFFVIWCWEFVILGQSTF
jgi:hypothetical protein